jgi:serine/threonine-protein kinase
VRRTIGVVKLSDFGLARARDRVASLTAPGTVKGKLSYLAPEVTLGKANSPQSDLFGVGSILWESLSGERLFDGKTDVEIFKKIRACQVPPILQRRPDVPPALAAVLDKSLDIDPARRYATAGDFVLALSSVMKYAPGIDLTGQLANAVHEMKSRMSGGHDQVSTSVEIEFSSPDMSADPIPLTNPKK